jgi:predicted nucleic acid-binding protein
LIDKSALARMIHEPVQKRLTPIIEAGAAATCAIIDLEVLYSAKNHVEHSRIRRRRELAYESVPVTEAALARAIDVQGQLSRSGRHRVPIPDLIIAAVAEAGGLTVLHYDSDYDVISEVTSQPVEWVVERGSVP